MLQWIKGRSTIVQTPLAGLILAAGQGKRMQSALPKVLHACADLPLVCHVIRSARQVGCAPLLLVVSPLNVEPLRHMLAQQQLEAHVQLVQQPQPRGTGDAVRVGLAALAALGVAPDCRVAVLYGDVPLLQPRTLQAVCNAAQQAPLAFLSAHVEQPHGYGRVLRNAQQQPVAIVEERDCTPAQQAIQEINAGLYVAPLAQLQAAVAQLRPNNAQQELYLTDIVAWVATQSPTNLPVAVPVDDVDDIAGVNSRSDLARVESLLQARLRAYHSARGVSFRDAVGSFIGVDVQFGQDVEIGHGVQLYGKTRLGDGVRVAGPSVLRDTQVGAHSNIEAFCHLEQATLEAHVRVGPYARLRPGAHLATQVHVGNFVEVKNSHLESGAKANHLAYLGDCSVGAQTNIGAGTIVCNYDGYQKHPTHIGAHVFVGSNSTLVAPLRLEDDVVVAAGSTLTESVPPGALAIARSRQINKAAYAAPLRQRLAAQHKPSKR